MFYSRRNTSAEKESRRKLQMEERGEPRCFLGIRIEKGPGRIILYQKQYIENLLEKQYVSNCKPLKTSISTNEKFMKATDDAELADETVYRSLMGSLLFLAKLTRPDNLVGVKVLSSFMAQPTKAHMSAVMRIMQYLHGYSNLKITYCKQNNHILLAESAANWSCDQNESKSATGFYFKYGCHSGATIMASEEATNCCTLVLRSRAGSCSTRSVISSTTIS